MKKGISIILCVVLVTTTIVFTNIISVSAKTVSDDMFTARVLSDGTAEIVSCTGKLSGTVVVPSEIEGYEVSSIGINFGDAKEVKIPKTVAKMNSESFISCSNLSSIKVSSDNKTFYSKAGVLFNKKTKTLMVFPSSKSSKSYSVPPKVKNIGEGAFNCSKYLETLNLENDTTKIFTRAIIQCEKLKKVKIGKKISSIGADAFCICLKLTSVTINGKVKTVGDKQSRHVFFICNNLKKLTIKKGGKFSLAGIPLDGKGAFNCAYNTSNSNVVPVNTTKAVAENSKELILCAKNTGSTKITVTEIYEYGPELTFNATVIVNVV